MTAKKPEQPCRDNEAHSGHLCELESQQEWEILRQVTDSPTVKCDNCGGAANSPRNVCITGDL